MKRCLLLINKISGNCSRAMNNPDVYNTLRKAYDVVDTLYIEENSPVDIKRNISGYDALAVCGGDGTFNNAINSIRDKKLDFIYIPCGTLNDPAKTLQLTSKLRDENRSIRRVDIGEIGGTLFSYVAAAGSFTAIGYKTNIKMKKKIKVLAYLFEVLREYKVHHIKAKIQTENSCHEGVYTLIMAINSQRCFGFNFNKMYDHRSGKAHLLLIKAPKGKGLLSMIKMFFPFFRAFFIGFKKPYKSKNIVFEEFSQAKVSLEDVRTFTIDGEKIDMKGEFDINIHKQKIKLYVY